MTPETVDLGRRDAGTLDPAALEREVARLWTEAGAGGKDPRIRSCLATLVVRAAGRSEPPWLDTLVGELPARTLVVHEEPVAAPDAWVSARCIRRPGESSWVCAESIHFVAAPTEDRRVASAVRALAVGGVPLVVVSPEASPLALPWVDRLGAECDVLLGESAAGDAIALWRRSAAPQRPVVRDLAWTRLRDWRAVLAATAEGSEGCGFFGDLSEVTLSTSGKEGRLAAWLLLGWLSSRLGWRPRTVTKEAVEFDGPRGAVAARIVEESATEPGLCAVGLTARERASITWRLHAEAKALVAEGCPGRRRLERRDLAACIAREAKIAARDPAAGPAALAAAALLEGAGS